MKTEKLKGLEINTGKSKGFAFETPPDLPKAHQSMLFVGKRSSGKTLSCVNLLEKMKYDRIFVISPSVKSNKEYMDRLNLNPDDIEDDVDDITCIDRVLAKIDQERDDLEEYWEKLERWKKFNKQLNEGYMLNDLEDEDLLDLFNPMTREFEKPKHKYNGKIPMIALLFDDVVGSMLFTKGIRRLNKLTIYHRHIAPFAEKGGAVGCSLYFLIQTYKAQAGGISKCIRNNTTSLVLFKSKNETESAKKEIPLDPFMTPEEQQRQLQYVKANPAEFTDFNIPWTLSVSYSFNFARTLKPDYSGYKIQTFNSLNLNGDFSLTPKWKIGATGYVDVEKMSIQQMSMFITREMHCWQLAINVTPIGLYKSFSITLNPKSGILRDLKINRSRTFSSSSY
jgi:hypothetical protein